MTGHTQPIARALPAISRRLLRGPHALGPVLVCSLAVLALPASPVHGQGALDYSPTGLMDILEVCTVAVRDTTAFEHPAAVEGDTLGNTVFLAGDPDAEGGAGRLAMMVTRDADTGAALDCDFRYNPFRDTADADIARTVAVGAMIREWVSKTGTTDPDVGFLCSDTRAAQITIREIDDLGVAVAIAPAPDTTQCPES